MIIKDLIEWNESFATGNLPIDTQHKELFDLVNQIHKNIMEGFSKETLKCFLDKLLYHTHHHFDDEEEFMRTIDYPRYDAHRMQHDTLRLQVKDLIIKYENKQKSLSIAVSLLLADWVRNHIRTEDFALIQWVSVQASIVS